MLFMSWWLLGSCIHLLHHVYKPVTNRFRFIWSLIAINLSSDHSKNVSKLWNSLTVFLTLCSSQIQAFSCDCREFRDSAIRSLLHDGQGICSLTKLDGSLPSAFRSSRLQVTAAAAVFARAACYFAQVFLSSALVLCKQLFLDSSSCLRAGRERQQPRKESRASVDTTAGKESRGSCKFSKSVKKAWLV